jgi:hypothetical protein
VAGINRKGGGMPPPGVEERIFSAQSRFILSSSRTDPLYETIMRAIQLMNRKAVMMNSCMI